jgi:hypothetical protein
MPIPSVPALYDGSTIRLLEQAPVSGPYHVLVTFVEPVGDVAGSSSALERFWASFGAWQDQESAETTVARIRQDRHSKADPPAL